MGEGILSIGDGGRDAGTYDTATDGPMTLVGEGTIGDVMVIQAGSQVRPQAPGGGGSVGDVSRSGGTSDNRIARWHGTNAEIQNTGVTIDDDDNIIGYGTLTGGVLGTQLVDSDGLLRILAIGQNGATDRQAMLWDGGGSAWIVSDILEPGMVDISADTNLAADAPIVLTDDTLSHAVSGVGAATYTSLTVDARGHVTGGTNPGHVLGAGTGTAGTIPLWDPDNDTLGDSALTQSGGNVTAAGNINALGTILSAISTFVGGTVSLIVTNKDDSDLSSHAEMLIRTKPTGGDPFIHWNILTGQSYVMGIDNSDSDKLVGSVGGDLGTANWLEVTTAGDTLLTGNTTIGQDLTITTGDVIVSAGQLGIGVTPDTLLSVGGNSVTTILSSSANNEGIEVVPGILRARVLIEGTTQGELILVDSGGTSNRRASGLRSADDRTTFAALNDAGVPVNDNIIVMDHDTGDVGIGVIPLTDVHVAMAAPADLSTLAGSLFLESASNAGDGNYGAGVLFGQPNAGVAANFGAAIVAKQTTADPNQIGLAFITHPSPGSGNPRQETMELDHLGNLHLKTGSLGIGVTPLTDVHIDMKAPATVSALAGSVFLQAFDNAGAGNFGAGIIFGQASGSISPATGAAGSSIVGFQDTANVDTAGLIFYTHEANAGIPRIEAMRLDSAQNMGVGGVAPTIAFDLRGKIGFTSIGGYAIKLTNKTGSNTVKGKLVVASTTTDDAFGAAIANALEVIGVVLEAGIADGSEAWVVVGGKGEVLMDGGGCVHGDRVGTGPTAGSATRLTSPSLAEHFREIGHSVQTVGASGLARTDLHFN